MLKPKEARGAREPLFARWPSPPRGVEFAAVLTGATALALVCFGPTLSYGLTDLDTMMNIAAARIDAAAELPALLLSKLTGGRAGSNANFYRPTVMALFAAVRGAFGWSPAAYHAVNLAIHVVCTVLVVAFARAAALRCGLTRPRSFSLWAGFAFGLHPVSIEVVPAIARVGDLLVAAGLIAGMLATDFYAACCEQKTPIASRTILARSLIFASLFALTITSKESGIALLVVAPLYLYFARRSAPIARRAIESAVLVAPAACVAAIFLWVRSRVLGEGLGGYHLDGSSWEMAKLVANLFPIDLTLPGFPNAVESALPLYTRLSLFESTALGYSLAGLTIVAAGLWCWGRLNSDSRTARRGSRICRMIERADANSRRPTAQLMLFAFSALAVFAILFIVTSTYDRRLLYPAIPFFVLPLAALFDRATDEGLHGVREGRWSLPMGKRIALFTAAAISASALVWQSPAVQRDREWREAGSAAHLVTEGLRDRWKQLPANSVVWIVNMAGGFDFDAARRIPYHSRSSTNAINARAIQAWLDDQLPERHLLARSLGTHRYREPLTPFRHGARIQRGWVEFDTPLARTDFDVALAAKREFRLRDLGEGRMALAPTAPRRSVPKFLLITDGASPVFVSLADLKVAP